MILTLFTGCAVIVALLTIVIMDTIKGERVYRHVRRTVDARLSEYEQLRFQ